MASVLEQLPREGRIAVVRLRSLGDCVLTTPALEILKRSRPDLRIAVVVEDRLRAVFERNPDIETLLEPRVAAVHAWRPDICLNLHGGVRSAVLTATSGATHRAGFGHFRFSFVYNIKIPTAQQILQVSRKVHTAEHLASAVIYLGAGPAEVPRAKMCAAPPGRRAVRPPYAVLHPFSSAPDKSWPPERFLSVAEHLQSVLDLEPVFIGGAKDDLLTFRGWETVGGAPLEEVKSLIAGASVFLGNDSGPAHMAAAFGIPVVVLFGPSDPVIWGPWRASAEVLTHPDGIAAIPGGDAIAALARLRVHA